SLWAQPAACGDRSGALECPSRPSRRLGSTTCRDLQQSDRNGSVQAPVTPLSAAAGGSSGLAAGPFSPKPPAMERPQLIDALSTPSAYSHPVEAVEVRQTHISVVFLAGSLAYKIKKPVDLGFVNYRSLERRRHFCEEEVRLNRRLAPEVYLGVVPVTR